MQQPGKESNRLEYLDGLRALAALYVCATHIAYSNFGNVLFGGSWAVACFIVLSGFCLSLPVERSGELRGGALEFIKRRAWRILPAYYGALVLTWVLGEHRGAASVISHILLIHNMSPAWVYSLDAPTWSLATE